MEDKRILFIRLRSLGDTVLMTPSLEVAKRRPGTIVGVVSEEPFHEVLENHPFIDRLFVVRREGKLASRAEAIAQIRKFRPDLAVDLHGGTTSALMTFLSGAKQRAGYQSNRLSTLYNCKIPESRTVWKRDDLHTVEHQLTPLRFLGFPVDPVPAPQVPVTKENLESVGRLLSSRGIKPGFILLHPAAAFDTKQWPAERFSQLIERLSRENYRVVATTGPGQESLLRAIESPLKFALPQIPPLALGEFIALASQCSLYVGNDTGTTHIAAALGKPIAVVFGSSNSLVWYPYQTRHRVIRSDLPCIPCPGYSCLHYSQPKCIQSIEVDSVFEAVKSLISGTGKK